MNLVKHSDVHAAYEELRAISGREKLKTFCEEVLRLLEENPDKEPIIRTWEIRPIIGGYEQELKLVNGAMVGVGENKNLGVCCELRMEIYK